MTDPTPAVETPSTWPDSACRHPRVSRWSVDGGEPRLWSCDECKRRFYPACPVCVDVGHGFRPSSKSDPAECYTLLDMADGLLALLSDRGHSVGTLSDAMATDRQLGLRPERGDWACPEDIARKALA